MLRATTFLLNLIAVSALVILPACARNPDATATPQAKVSHHAANVLNAVAELQKGVTAAAKSSPAFLPTARQITEVVEQIHSRSGQLQEALRSYDAASTLQLKRLAEEQVYTQLVAINKLIGDAFGIPITDSSASSISKLIATVAQLVATLSEELAKVRLQ